MYVRRQDNVSTTTNEEAKKKCKFVCPHIDCDFVCYTKPDMNIHADKCAQANTYRFEKVLDCEGPPLARKYLIKWEGINSENTWVPHTPCGHHRFRKDERAF